MDIKDVLKQSSNWPNHIQSATGLNHPALSTNKTHGHAFFIQTRFQLFKGSKRSQVTIVFFVKEKSRYENPNRKKDK